MNASVHDVTRMRQREEKEAADTLGYDVEFGHLPEPNHRYRMQTFDEVMDPSLSPTQDPSFEAAQSVVQRVAQRPVDLVLAPLGIGGHIDHRILNCICVRMLKAGMVHSMAFYEDLPYAGEMELSQLAETERQWGTWLRPHILCRDGLQDKLQALQAYKSQLIKRHIDCVCQHHARVGGERIWLPLQSYQAVRASDTSLATRLQ
jgi:LmbE family N-acetylglucosaminyl deacetylase